MVLCAKTKLESFCFVLFFVIEAQLNHDRIVTTSECVCVFQSQTVTRHFTHTVNKKIHTLFTFATLLKDNKRFNKKSDMCFQ